MIERKKFLEGQPRRPAPPVMRRKAVKKVARSPIPLPPTEPVKPSDAVVRPMKKAVKKTTKKVAKKAVAAVDVVEKFYAGVEAKAKKESTGFVLPVAGNLHLLSPPIEIPFPSFCLEMLTGATGLPLGHMVTVTGPPMSCKSSLIHDMISWVTNDAGGLAELIETEAKDLGALGAALTGLTNTRWKMSSPGSTCRDAGLEFDAVFEMVQRQLTAGLSSARAASNPAKRVTTPPIMWIIDSLTGVPSQEEQKQVDTHGSIGRNWPVVALASTKFLPVYLEKLAKGPWMLATVVHCSTKEVGTFAKTTSVDQKGGQSWQYRAKLQLFMEQQGLTQKTSQKVNADGSQTYNIVMRALKSQSSLQYRLPVQLYTRPIVGQNKETGEKYNKTAAWFTWHTSSINLLMKPTMGGFPASWESAIQDVLGLKAVNKKPLYYAEPLGISESDALSPGAFMRKLYATPDVLKKLRAVLGIRAGVPYKKDSNFYDLRDESRRLGQEIIDRERILASGVSSDKYEVLTEGPLYEE